MDWNFDIYGKSLRSKVLAASNLNLKNLVNFDVRWFWSSSLLVYMYLLYFTTAYLFIGLFSFVSF